jgi:type IX secretion system PorP/SprF family membrane protein
MHLTMKTALNTTIRDMKKTFAILVAGTAILMGQQAQAQQDPMYSQYQFNTMAVNPAYAGATDALTFIALHRSQWTGFEGAPVTQTFAVHAPLGEKHINTAVGLSVINDKIGPTKQTGFFVDYSYKLRMDEKTYLRFGLKAGGNLFSANLMDIATNEQADAAFQSNISSQFLPNFGFGLYWDSEKYYVGASLPKLKRNVLGSELASTSANEQNVFNEKRHFFFVAGYIAKLNEEIEFKPSLVVKKVAHAPASLDLSANFLLKKKVWLGVNYRFGDAVGAVAQFRFTEQLRAGYSYDFTISDLGQYSGGTHEIMLRFDIVPKPKTEGTPSVDPIDQ